ncbi:hypothetical protein PG993_013191 [Apiospora rasikravindrae]|uniref:NB-ARC domain-containing protein n=1 Tax=Apiospora rasikravindrae TaxID=990691 RepID=A0ABR1RWX9_9PEZI
MTLLQLAEALSRLGEPGLGTTENHFGSAMIRSDSVAKRRILMLPDTKTNRLFDRVDIYLQLDRLLTPDAVEFVLQSVALHGLAGVGKTSIASSYAEKKYRDHVYDVVLWVRGEKYASLRQSFTDIALRLKLPGAQSQSHDENQILVHDWLENADCRWLIVYDNVESAQTLRPFWPRATNRGRAIVTTRNHSLGFDPAESGIEITSWDTDTGAAYLLFLLKKRIGRDIDSEGISARSLSGRLSGHALAISQMAGLIYEGEYSIQEFMTIYMKSPQSVHSIGGLGSLWQFVFESLDENCLALLGIISFLEPDCIPPEVFKPDHEVELPSNLEFLRDQYIGAFRKLSIRALIKRDKDSGILTVHRLIQTQFRYFLDHERRQKAFNDTVTLLSLVLPKSDIEKGQLYDGWEKYNHYLQHVISLRDIFNEEFTRDTLIAPVKFCELLNDYQRYLYEKCDFEECERTCAVNRAAVSTLSSKKEMVDLECTILSHLSQVFEERGDFLKAIKICQQEIDLRLRESPQKKILLAYSTGNLGISYESANNFPKALECFKDARKWWEAHFAEKGEDRKYDASIIVYEARCMIGLGDFDVAKEMLDTAVAQAKEEVSLNFGTLSSAYYWQGTLSRSRGRFEDAETHFLEAQNAWLMGDQTRVHPFNASIMYNIGACCLDQGKVEASIKHIRDSMEVTEVYKRLLPIDHGRNLFKLSEAMGLGGVDKATDAATLKNQAEYYLRMQEPRITEMGNESTYSDLITISRR